MYRSRTGGNEWEALTNGLPQSDCYVNVLRNAMAVDSLDPCGVYFGTTGGQVYGSADCRRSLGPDRPRSCRRSFRSRCRTAMTDAAMIRVMLPAHLRMLAKVARRGATRRSPSPVTQRSVLDALEARYPMLRGTIRDHVTHERRAFLRFFACEQDLSHESTRRPAARGRRLGRGDLFGHRGAGGRVGMCNGRRFYFTLNSCCLMSLPWAS